MERLCVEVLQLIFFELVDPSPLTLVSRRLYSFSQDPYVRARYFLAHYGPAEAMFQALGRGKLLTERVIDILLSSGAHLSRYLVQIAMHHYFHTQTHFIRTPWVRNVPFGVFVYFMQKAHAKYGDIPRGKGEDDGSLFMTFLKESRFPSHLKSVTWENILEILEQYKFMPFSNRDPIMAQFPLILAIEPRLLPAAVENGFRMDYKYRDFVFRKMFERHTGDTQAEDVANNIRELCQLDPTMFVSRTVAAEVCMEAKYNDVGYGALKQLGKTGDLRFELRTLVEDLLKTFLTTRTIAHSGTGDILRQLYSDYPSTDPIVRLVVITAIFISAENSRLGVQQVHANLEATGLTPLTRKDAYNVLINPFVEKYTTVLDYAREEIGTNGDGGKGLGEAEARGLVEDVARKCLQVGCKGKLLNRLIEGFPHLKDVLVNEVAERHQIRLEEVPSWVGQGSVAYTAKLSGDYARKRSGESPYWDDSEGNVLTRNVEMGSDQAGNDVDRAPREEPLMLSASEHEVLLSDLGDISQESLTNMIRQDELAPTRARRRWFYTFAYPDFGKANYPHDALPVAKCILNQYGTRSKIVAIFLTHAIINDNTQVLFSYLMRTQDSSFSSFKIDLQVPVTLKHFQILARLGRAPSYCIYHCIEAGAPFYLDEDDYISKSDPAKSLISALGVKHEPPNLTIPSSPSSSTRPPSLRGRERLRRLATTSVRSYAVPDSDDDIIMDSDDGLEPRRRKQAPKKSDLQLWIQHLAELQKSENKKFKEQKKIYDAAGCEGTTARFRKNAFLKSLSTQLRSLRKLDIQTREKQGMLGEDLETLDDEDDDDEYTLRPSKRKKTCTHPPISLAL
ncbi:hypothetical protein CC1G_03014 [Coprinopsis cinerea okayama7|uniref:Uncharacterized protein n=1 Tax=Coprinopsis cinerea (strain Okayama-7 / 130 / ATCC MYA-4618 / FGSC 9003) TaxID=240176 RepID=A8NS34_COPC7|nr:hypothetical protein CC1G_03014 [Coprinopsis cinerea okayama7\|eukprot:XP_001835926.2 hypothetical protein CC1G_03014 [Coprinopsis cinerea okayama7\